MYKFKSDVRFDLKDVWRLLWPPRSAMATKRGSLKYPLEIMYVHLAHGRIELESKVRRRCKLLL